jgi:aspartate/methionine/tyrosine aminotransferase
MGMPTPELLPGAKRLNTILRTNTTGRAHYQPQAGALATRAAIAQYESKRTGLPYTADHIMLVAGAIRGFSAFVDFLATRTEQYVELLPTYPLLAGHVRNAAARFGQRIITLRPRDQHCFQFGTQELTKQIAPRSLVYLTNPNNPTGLYANPQALDALLKACAQTRSYLFVDESCDMPMTAAAQMFWRKSKWLVRIVGLSKNALLAGYRAGYVVGHPKLIAQVADSYTFSDANAPTVVNEAIVRFIQDDKAAPKANRIIGDKVAKVVNRLQAMPRIRQVIEPEGGYYLLAKVAYAGSWPLFEHLLRAGVNVVPADLFGLGSQTGESWMRLCCLRDDDTLNAGLAIIEQALSL